MKNYIFFDDTLAQRAGGPSTYLYNLRNGINKIDKHKIEFICKEEQENANKNEKFFNKIKSVLFKFPYLYERLYIHKRNEESALYNELKRINNGDIVMFHMTLDYAKARKHLPDNCIKVLMSHSPEITSNQIVNDLKVLIKSNNYKFKYLRNKYLNDFDLFSFKDADIIVFPSKEAMEPYYETCEEFGDIIKNKKIKFLPTGTEQLKVGIDRDEFRKKYNIPHNAFVITFIGRHNLVKGYDNFVEICSKILEMHDDVYIVTAGVGDIDSPKSDRWIDIGWTNDPGTIANAADLFVLPNKRTYFDLVLIEMISIGKTCLVSNTGGNKTMAKYSDGIILYNNINEAVKKINELYNKRELIEEYSKCNLSTYKENFTPEIFTKNYINLMEEIRNEEKY